ncbi:MULTISPECIES: OmpA family protein [unclassified Sphingobacterium]|uniref:OmpA family protein n=1 Tax=unclassified Sphingobacterium TaxID=2609468 RepID=UPI00265D05B9|nr:MULTISPECIES: OmpA family protein [unclassified Sphingobacterium]WKK59268.1 OmpA family protein [Sphingobacterium sp. BN32]
MKTNYLKKASLFAVAGLITSTAFAQQNTTTVEGTTPLGSSSEYRTWSIGVNAGLLNQSNIFGFNRAGFDKLDHNVGYSAYIKKQISPSFGLKAQYLGGKVSGTNEDAAAGTVSAFETKMPWSAALSGEFTLANTNWRFFNSIIKPYASIGLGALNFETTTTVDGTASTADSQTKLYVPIDAGFKFAVAKGINIDLGYQLNWANQDFDGVRGGQYKNDLFSYAHAGLEIALGDGSKPYLGNSNPVATMVKKYDELKAERDALVASNEALKSELSGISNDLKDDDGDGVANKFDKCPNTPAGVKVDGAGCPLPEMKHETKVVEKIVVTEEDRKVVDEAIKNLEFDLGKATIRSTSYESLNRVAALLIEKNFSLKLAGHTDNTGSMQTNLRLSKERAESVKSYLVSKGANASRIEATGYGPNQPIATNKTAEGRQQNRRVEFTLY